jgi:hypothetical protein
MQAGGQIHASQTHYELQSNLNETTDISTEQATRNLRWNCSTNDETPCHDYDDMIIMVVVVLWPTKDIN